MEQPISNEKSTPKAQNKDEKKEVGQLFGIQLSAPKGMKNPGAIFLVLVIGNFLLLFGLGKALGLF
ncbi:hypothetical protein [Prochlorococcus sp. MIT 1307]|uniref:hypothetical protein n=1 Tax=Prochlorococcus sp. MIT 1307 TaxID=3096219 RepID=UPI002A7613A8|nr:hypothetical protein [Prochlorococcus sp. MIT 1307]